MIDKIVMGIITIAQSSVVLGEMLISLLKGIGQVLMMVPLVFNPVKLVNDALLGIIMAIKVLVISLFSFKIPSLKKTDKCSNTGEGLFGYRRKRDKNGKLTALDAEVKNRGCVRPTTIKLLLTILCPPLGLFLHLGIKGWFHVILSAALTVYAYYFPGLMYVLLHILC